MSVSTKLFMRTELKIVCMCPKLSWAHMQGNHSKTIVKWWDFGKIKAVRVSALGKT